MKRYAWSDNNATYLFEAEDDEQALRIVIGARLRANGITDLSKATKKDLATVQGWVMDDTINEIDSVLEGDDAVPYAGPLLEDDEISEVMDELADEAADQED